MLETNINTINDAKISTRYWEQVALSVREGLKVHWVSEQIKTDLETHERPLGNITEHCLVQVPRCNDHGTLLGLPTPLISDMKLSAILHDGFKIQEITATRHANKTGDSPLRAVRAFKNICEDRMRNAGFSDRIIRLGGASGGDAPQLFEIMQILDKETLSNDDWAYLVVHYVDDCSIGADWVPSARNDEQGKPIANVIDFRAEGNRAKADYSVVSREVSNELTSHPVLGPMGNIDAAAYVSHRIEERIAQRIAERTGNIIEPLLLPELVDRKIVDEISAL